MGEWQRGREGGDGSERRFPQRGGEIERGQSTDRTEVALLSVFRRQGAVSLQAQCSAGVDYYSEKALTQKVEG